MIDPDRTARRGSESYPGQVLAGGSDQGDGPCHQRRAPLEDYPPSVAAQPLASPRRWMSSSTINWAEAESSTYLWLLKVSPSRPPRVMAARAISQDLYPGEQSTSTGKEARYVLVDEDSRNGRRSTGHEARRRQTFFPSALARGPERHRANSGGMNGVSLQEGGAHKVPSWVAPLRAASGGQQVCLLRGQ